MDAQVSTAIVSVESLGNIPASAVEFYDKVKPTNSIADHLRLAFLRFKTDKEKNTRRASMAVAVPKLDPDNFSGKTDHEFVTAILHDYHDSLISRAANGEIKWDDAISQDFMVKDYFDNTRDSNGRKVSKESIGAWYDSTVAKTIEIRAKTKNAQMTAETVARTVAGYREMFQKFTGYNLVNLFTDTQLELLTVVMLGTEFPQDDSIAEYVMERITKIQEAKKTQDALIDAI